MSPSGPTPPGTALPSFTSAQGDDASGKVKFTAWLTLSEPALPTALALYGCTAPPESAAGAASALVGNAAAPAATPPVNFQKFATRDKIAHRSPPFVVAS